MSWGNVRVVLVKRCNFVNVSKSFEAGGTSRIRYMGLGRIQPVIFNDIDLIHHHCLWISWMFWMWKWIGFYCGSAFISSENPVQPTRKQIFPWIINLTKTNRWHPKYTPFSIVHCDLLEPPILIVQFYTFPFVFLLHFHLVFMRNIQPTLSIPCRYHSVNDFSNNNKKTNKHKVNWKLIYIFFYHENQLLFLICLMSFSSRITKSLFQPAEFSFVVRARDIERVRQNENCCRAYIQGCFGMNEPRTIQLEHCYVWMNSLVLHCSPLFILQMRLYFPLNPCCHMDQRLPFYTEQKSLANSICHETGDKWMDLLIVFTKTNVCSCVSNYVCVREWRMLFNYDFRPWGRNVGWH